MTTTPGCGSGKRVDHGELGTREVGGKRKTTQKFSSRPFSHERRGLETKLMRKMRHERKVRALF